MVSAIKASSQIIILKTAFQIYCVCMCVYVSVCIPQRSGSSKTHKCKMMHLNGIWNNRQQFSVVELIGTAYQEEK